MPVGGLFGTPMPMGMYGMNMNSNMYQGNYSILPEQGKRKGKLKEADFEAAFAQAAASFSPVPADESPAIMEVDDNVTDVEQTSKSTTLEGDTKVEGRDEFTE